MAAEQDRKAEERDFKQLDEYLVPRPTRRSMRSCRWESWPSST